MKGTRPLDNDEIRQVSNVFSRMYKVRNRGLCFLFFIFGLFMGCGGDTNTADTVMFVEVKPPRVRRGDTIVDRFYDRWHAEFDVVFEGIPADLEAEFELKTTAKEPFAANWEQTRNIVTLHFDFTLISLVYRTSPTSHPAGELILGREHQKQSVEVTLAWSDGRKIFTVEAYPSESLFVGRSDIL